MPQAREDHRDLFRRQAKRLNPPHSLPYFLKPRNGERTGSPQAKKTFMTSGEIKTHYHVTYDRRVTCGSPEHFFHFLWGYLLPALHVIHTATDTESSRYLFRSCGPVMDALTSEVMHLFKYPFRIVSSPSNEDANGTTRLLIPRWDLGLYRAPLLTQDTVTSSHFLRMREELKQHKALRNALEATTYMADLAAAIAHVKSVVIEKVNAVALDTDLATYAGCYLILARSPEPEFYARGGEAEIPLYGTSRRALLGIKEAARHLRQKYIPIRAFEPGKYSLTAQIKVFQRCRGVIGIRGAEFANMIWMQPRSQVLLIEPGCMNWPSVHKTLADILELNYLEIEDHQGPYPVLQPEMVVPYLM